MVPLLALLLVVGCSTEPTEKLRGGVAKLNAAPTQLFLEPGKSKTVDIGAVDEQGNPIADAYEVTEVGPGITVRRDSTFLPVFVNDSTLAVPATGPVFRFVVTADAFGTGAENFPTTSFTVGGGGRTIKIPVQVTALSLLEATFSSQTPALGDTITITAPAGVKFDTNATLTFAGAPQQPLIVGRSADSTSIRFLAPPNAGGPLTVTGVIAASTPTIRLQPSTSLSLSTPQFDSVDVAFSNPAPAIGDVVTITPVNPLIKFQLKAPTPPSVTPTISAVNFTGQVAAPVAVTIAADSSTLTFQAPPNAAGAARVDSLIFPGGYALSLPTRQGITAGTVPSPLNAAFSNLTPGLGELVTLTAPANFHFTKGTGAAALVLNFGTKIGVVQSISTDSTQVTFLPLPGVTAPLDVVGLRYATAPQFSVRLPTADTLTVPQLVPLRNADDPATAPTFTVPGPGGTTTVFDAGEFGGAGDCCFGGPTRLYKITLTATTTLTGTVDWFEGQDLGWYWTEADGVTPTGNFDGDSNGSGASGHPETTTVTLDAGTYYIAIANFSATNPNLMKLTLSQP